MEGAKDYLLSVTAAALICGSVGCLAGEKGSISRLMKLLCGMFLAVTVIGPVVNVKIDDLSVFTDRLAVDAELTAAIGEEKASDEMKRIIKEKSEAYILDKAKSLGADLKVNVVLEDVIPVGVTLTGDISPFAKTSLAASIVQDLGIPLEEQVWT